MPEQFPNPDKIKEEKERIKEEVQAFKERTEGLNPEIFGVPGEGSLEKENIPEEMILAYELEEKIKEYTEKAKLVKSNFLKFIESRFNEKQIHQQSAWYTIYIISSFTNSSLWPEINKEKQKELINKAQLIKNRVLKEIESDFDGGQTDAWNAWYMVRGLSALINSPLWLEIDKEKQEELIEKARLVENNVLKKIESNLNNGRTDQESAYGAVLGLASLIHSPLWVELSKNKQKELIKKTQLVKDKFFERVESYLDKGQTSKGNAWYAILGLSSLTTLKNYLLKVANQKLKEQEHQKALHPEKEIPPRPETKIF